MSTTSVSSTSAFTSIRDRSETVRTSVPGLFMVPVITFSPTSTLSALTIPSNGATNRVLLRLSSEPWTAASARATSSRAVATAICAASSLREATSHSACESSFCSHSAFCRV